MHGLLGVPLANGQETNLEGKRPSPKDSSEDVHRRLMVFACKLVVFAPNFN
jgi:hypothetical protein